MPNNIVNNLKELKVNANKPPFSDVVESQARRKSVASTDAEVHGIFLVKSLAKDLGHLSGVGANSMICMHRLVYLNPLFFTFSHFPIFMY